MSVAEIAMHVNKSEREVLDYIVAARLNIKEVHTVIKNEMIIMRDFMEKKIDKIKRICSGRLIIPFLQILA